MVINDAGLGRVGTHAAQHSAAHVARVGYLNPLQAAVKQEHSGQVAGGAGVPLRRATYSTRLQGMASGCQGACDGERRGAGG